MVLVYREKFLSFVTGPRLILASERILPGSLETHKLIKVSLPLVLVLGASTVQQLRLRASGGRAQRDAHRV